MTQKTIAIADATEEQLRRFAQDKLGMPVHVNAKIETIRAKIKTKYDGATIEVEDEPAPAASVAAAPPPPAAAARSGEPQPPAPVEEPRYVINIPETEAVGGRDAVPVCVNGINMWIPRARDVEVKHRYVEVLRNARQTIYEQKYDDKGHPSDLSSREVLAYPFTIVASPTAEAVAAWSDYKRRMQEYEVAQKQSAARVAQVVFAGATPTTQPVQF